MKLQRVAQQAQRYPEMVFNNVSHLIDCEFLREAYRQTRKSSAPGVDKVTAQPYADNLDDNLRALHERLRSSRHRLSGCGSRKKMGGRGRSANPALRIRSSSERW